MLMLQCALHIIHSGIRHATALKPLEPVGRGPLNRDTFNERLQDRSILHAKRVCEETRIRRPFRVLEPLAHDAVQSIVTAAEQNVTIGGFKGLVRDNGRYGAQVSP